MELRSEDFKTVILVSFYSNITLCPISRDFITQNVTNLWNYKK